MADVGHENDNPATDCHLDTAVEEEEYGTDPGDLVCE
jgi:hypothetical protein